MFLATTRHGIIATILLVDNYYKGAWTSAPEIAERYKMNVRALHPALTQLVRSGILRSRVGGKTPGFLFTRDPELVTMDEVITSLQGRTIFTCCKDEIEGLECDKTCDNTEEICWVYNLVESTVSTAHREMAKMTVAKWSKQSESKQK